MAAKGGRRGVARASSRSTRATHPTRHARGRRVHGEVGGPLRRALRASYAAKYGEPPAAAAAHSDKMARDRALYTTCARPLAPHALPLLHHMRCPRPRALRPDAARQLRPGHAWARRWASMNRGREGLVALAVVLQSSIGALLVRVFPTSMPGTGKFDALSPISGTASADFSSILCPRGSGALSRWSCGWSWLEDLSFPLDPKLVDLVGGGQSASHRGPASLLRIVRGGAAATPRGRRRSGALRPSRKRPSWPTTPLPTGGLRRSMLGQARAGVAVTVRAPLRHRAGRAVGRARLTDCHASSPRLSASWSSPLGAAAAPSAPAPEPARRHASRCCPASEPSIHGA